MLLLCAACVKVAMYWYEQKYPSHIRLRAGVVVAACVQFRRVMHAQLRCVPEIRLLFAAKTANSTL